MLPRKWGIQRLLCVLTRVDVLRHGCLLTWACSVGTPWWRLANFALPCADHAFLSHAHASYSVSWWHGLECLSICRPTKLSLGPCPFYNTVALILDTHCSQISVSKYFCHQYHSSVRHSYLVLHLKFCVYHRRALTDTFVRKRKLYGQ